MTIEPSNAPSKGRARFAILVAALLWSTGGAAIKLSTLTAPQIASGRAAVAALVLFLFVRRARRRWNRRILLSALAYATTCILFVFANTLTTAGNAIFIQNIAPVWVLLLSQRITKELPSHREKISVPISLVACALFFLDDISPGRLSGNAIALGASLSYALLILSYRRLDTDEGLSATLLGNMIIVGVCGASWWATTSVATQDVAVVCYLGAVQQVIPALLFLYGIRGVSALEGALLTLFEPLLSPIWAFAAIGERLGSIAASGAALIVATTIWRARSPDQAEP